MVTPSTILAWTIPRPEEPTGYSPRGHKELDMTEHTHTHRLSLSLAPTVSPTT